ncbi:MAG: aldo/keto reductase [Ignavibacteria bacterium RBG_16_34_14]|nr:MAG: aldo/keto reductase [Ignavibacteria bacterium RBG_16_34_14]
MEYRNLGRTGVKVSPLCLGCMMFGRKADEKLSMEIVDKAIDEGINFFDTANAYQRGISEEYLGKALKRNGKRDSVIIATKVHGMMKDNDPNAGGISRRHIIAQCDASLKRLQTEYIDIYQLHRPQSDIAIDESLRVFDDLIKSGKVRYIGTSTFAPWQVVNAIWVSKELGLNRFISEQPPYHLLDRRIERELFPVAQNFGLAILPWAPLAGGFLTGKYKRGKERPADSRFKDSNEWADHHFTEEAFKVLDVVEEIAKEKKCSSAQLALSWTIQKPEITSSIIGPKNLDQLIDNLGALKVKLTDEDNRRFDKVSMPGRTILSYYEVDFNYYKYR